MRTLLALAACATLFGCAKTQLITEPGARIYVDGQLAGVGRAEIRRNGIPSAVHVQVESDDGRRKEVVLKRHFTWATAGVGLITYGVGLLTFWQHPSGVQIALEPRPGGGWGDEDEADPWLDGGGADPWMSGDPTPRHASSP